MLVALVAQFHRSVKVSGIVLVMLPATQVPYFELRIQVVLAEFDGERLEGERIFFLSSGTRFRSSSTALTTRCFKKTAKGAIRSWSLKVFLSCACIEASDCYPRWKVWLNVSCRAPPWNISVNALSKIQRKAFTMRSMAAQCPLVKTR